MVEGTGFGTQLCGSAGTLGLFGRTLSEEVKALRGSNFPRVTWPPTLLHLHLD